MKRILLVFAILAGSVFMAAPATAEDLPAGETTATTATETQSTPEQTTPEQTTPEQTTPEQTTPEQTTPEQTTPEQTTPEQTVPEQTTTDAPDATVKSAPLTKAAEADGDVSIAAVLPPTPEDKKVTLCHFNEGNESFFTVISVSKQTILNGNSEHLTDENDIIPPFSDTEGHSFPGQNYTEQAYAECQGDDIALIEVTATSPGVNDPTCDADGSLDIPTITGVEYTSDPDYNGDPGTYHVTAEAAQGYVLAPGSFTEGDFTVEEQLSGEDCDGPKVTICHSTFANPQADNPYVEISVSVNGINGHDGHTGPIYQDGFKESKTEWGDIIPPIDDPPFPGLNWPAGEAILNNGCNIPDVVETPLTSPSFTLLDQCTGDVVDTNTDGLTQIVPLAGDGGYTWEFTEGDGQNGEWTLQFTPKDGFAFADDAVHSVSGDAGTSADCEEPAEAGVLPDTGGSSPWILLMGVGLTVAGMLLLSARAALGLAGSGPVGAPAPMTWTQEVLTTRELKSHRGQGRRQGWLWILTGKRS